MGLSSNVTPKPLAIPKHFPCIDIEFINSDECDDFLKNNKPGIVGALIRNSGYETMDESIVDEIYKKNLQLNKKTTKRLLLADKQGILQIRSAGDLLYSNQDLRKVHDLAEMVLVFERLLDQMWSLRPLQPNLTDFSLIKVLDWIQTPQAHLSDSVTNLKLWDLLSQEFHLAGKGKKRIGCILARTGTQESCFSRISGWWELPDLEVAIRAAVQDMEGLKFAVIKDPAFRSIIAADLDEAERSLEWKELQSRSYFVRLDR